YGNFKLLNSFPVEYAPITVSKWRSQKTGLTVVVGSHAAPITNGHFVIASEIFDDTGRPHTLEHLVFLGSKSFPYKGVLDQLANRAGSNGTNAWTANDHTAYTIATAGSEGFLRMLPVYIDHVLHPTITDAGFVTEVHHINGKGEDAGVVYSEMQARENQSGDLMALELQRSLYPPSSAYRSETGGLLANLRVLTAQQIRDYHAKYYVPHNLCLLIDGAVPLPVLFHILNTEVDPMIFSHLPPNTSIPPPGWKRPFVETSTASELSVPQSETKVVEFMEEDESMGEVSMVWLGPQPTDYRTNLALKLLGSYLTDSATSPLQKHFVEIPKPLCTGIDFYSEDRVNKNELQCFIADVPAKYLESIGDMINEKLREIAGKEDIDMERMGLVLRRDKRKLLNYMETSVSSVLANAVIGDFLYGEQTGGELPRAFDDLKDYDALSGWTSKDWTNLLKKYYVDPNCITIVGKPSAALSNKIETDEKERIAKRKKELGEDKLKELDRKLEEAKIESDKQAPEDMITSFPITNPAGLTWVPVETAINNVQGQEVKGDQGVVQKHLDRSDIRRLRFQAHFADVQSNFISVAVLFDTKKVPAHLMAYLSILQSSLFSLPLKRPDGTTLTHEEVVDQLNDFTVSQNISFSYRSCFSEVLCIALKVEKTDFEKAVTWIRDLVTGVMFTKDRLQVIVAKLLQELPYSKRDGGTISRAWANRLVYDVEKSTSEACGLLNSLNFVPQTAELLESNPDEVIAKMDEARQYLLDPEIIRVSVTGDILGVQDPIGVLWESFLPFKEASTLSPLSTAFDTLSDLGKSPAKKCVLVPMSAIEGSYSIHYARGLHGWDHPDLPALRLASATLNASESYLWKSIRGSGLAYGANIEVDAESGLTGFSVYRSPNAQIAYEAAGKLLRDLADGTVELDRNLVDGARSLLTYEYARKSETVSSAASTAYLNEVLKEVGKNNDQEMLKKLPRVTLDQIRNAITTYILPIFDSSTAVGAVSVSSGKADEVEAGFKKLGFEVERKELPTLGGDDSEDDSMGSGSGSESDDGMESGAMGSERGA
ncbi:cytoplasm protein, partial [Naematelia encephala]